MKILLIEDEVKLAKFIVSGLSAGGHSCDDFTDGSGGLEASMVVDYDLILLDLMLPGMNGYEVLTNLRSFKNLTPVLIISALSETGHVIKGLDLGAVDYIKKPFDFDELLARVRAAQRRSLSLAGHVMEVGDLRMDLLGREVSRGRKKVNLSNKEFALLEYLLSHANQVVTKSQILDKIWDINFDPGSNIVEVHLYQLRKKIDKDQEFPLIHTVVGRGYVLKGDVIKS
jgi:DNA-binding response OmpR family regulator